MNFLRYLVAMHALALGSTATAAEFCVTTAAQFQQALMMAGNNGQADTIKIETGTYASTGGAVAFAYNTGENFSLIVQGGWVSNPPVLCARQLPVPTATILSGSDVRQVLKITGATGTIGGLSLSNLTLRDGMTSQTGAGLEIGGGGGFTGNVLVYRVIVERNVSTQFGGGMKVYTEGIANIRNNLFLLNRCTVSNCAISATVNATDPTAVRAFFGNNTIVGNQCTSGSSCTATGARFGGSARAVFYNNVFAANSNGDIDLLSLGSGSVDLYYNNYVSLTGTAPSSTVGNIAFANPQFVDLLGEDFRPTLGSPMRNAGTDQFVLQATDLAGEPRINEGRVDIGAYENSDRIFADAFELFE